MSHAPSSWPTTSTASGAGARRCATPLRDIFATLPPRPQNWPECCSGSWKSAAAAIRRAGGPDPARSGRADGRVRLRRHRGGLPALGSLHDFEADPLRLLQAAETLRVDRRVMHEHIIPTILGRDETEALGVVEPLDRTGSHCETPSPNALPQRNPSTPQERARCKRLSSETEEPAHIRSSIRSNCAFVARCAERTPRRSLPKHRHERLSISRQEIG